MTGRTYTVVVTGVGALIGQGIAKGLHARGDCRVIGVDRRGSLIADQLCDRVLQKPDCAEDSAEYRAFWASLLRDEAVDLVLPGISVDMVWLDAQRDLFADTGVAVGLNRAELIALAEDKAQFAKAYAAVGLPMIPSCPEGTDWAQACDALGPPPLLLKPRVGEGSAGIVRLQDAEDHAYWTRKSAGNFLLQKIIGTDSEEYTVGVFGFGDGTANGPLVFARSLTRSGHTGEARVVNMPQITEATAKIVAWCRPIGPTNLQFRMADGLPYLLEINPRFSSSCSLRVGFGYNEASMAVDYYLNDQRPPTPPLRTGRAQRYNEDVFAYDAGPNL